MIFYKLYLYIYICDLFSYWLSLRFNLFFPDDCFSYCLFYDTCFISLRLWPFAELASSMVRGGTAQFSDSGKTAVEGMVTHGILLFSLCFRAYMCCNAIHICFMYISPCDTIYKPQNIYNKYPENMEPHFWVTYLFCREKKRTGCAKKKNGSTQKEHSFAALNWCLPGGSKYHLQVGPHTSTSRGEKKPVS